MSDLDFQLTQPQPPGIGPISPASIHTCVAPIPEGGRNGADDIRQRVFIDSEGQVHFLEPGQNPQAGWRSPTPDEMGQIDVRRGNFRGNQHQMCVGAPENGASWPAENDDAVSATVYLYQTSDERRAQMLESHNFPQGINRLSFHEIDYPFTPNEALSFLEAGYFDAYIDPTLTAQKPGIRIRVSPNLLQQRTKSALSALTGFDRDAITMETNASEAPNSVPFFRDVPLLFASLRVFVEPQLESVARLDAQNAENSTFRAEMSGNQDKMMLIMMFLGAATVISTYVAARGAGLTRSFDNFVGNIFTAVRETPRRLLAGDFAGLGRRWRGIFGESSPIMQDFTDRVRSMNLPLTEAGQQVSDGFDRGGRPHVIDAGPSGSGKGHAINTAAAAAVQGRSGVDAFEGRPVRYVRISASNIVREAGSWLNRAETLFFQALDGLSGKNPVIVHLTEADAFAEAGQGPGNKPLNLLAKLYQIMEGGDPRYENLHFILDSTRWEKILEAAPDILRRAFFVEVQPQLPQVVRVVLDVGIDSRVAGNEGRVLRGRYSRVNLTGGALDAVTALGDFEEGAPPSSHLAVMDGVVTEVVKANPGTSTSIEITETHVIQYVARRTGRTEAQVEAELRSLLEGGIENNPRIQARIVEGFYRVYNPRNGRVNPLEGPEGPPPEAATEPEARPGEARDAERPADPVTDPLTARTEAFRPIVREIEDRYDVRISSNILRDAIDWVDRDGAGSIEQRAEQIQCLLERAAEETGGSGRPVTMETFIRVYGEWADANASGTPEALSTGGGNGAGGVHGSNGHGSNGVVTRTTIALEIRDRYTILDAPEYRSVVDAIAEDILSSWESRHNGAVSTIEGLPSERFVEEGMERSLRRMEETNRRRVAEIIRTSDRGPREDRDTERLREALREARRHAEVR